jgi:hypothetical protein
MVKMYRATTSPLEIKEYEVLNATPFRVTYVDEMGKKRTEARNGTYHVWADAWETTREALRQRARSKVDNYRQQLERARSYADRVEKLKR